MAVPFVLYVCPHCDSCVELLADAPADDGAALYCDDCGTPCQPYDDEPDRAAERRGLTSSFMREG